MERKTTPLRSLFVDRSSLPLMASNLQSVLAHSMERRTISTMFPVTKTPHSRTGPN